MLETKYIAMAENMEFDIQNVFEICKVTLNITKNQSSLSHCCKFLLHFQPHNSCGTSLIIHGGGVGLVSIFSGGPV